VKSHFYQHHLELCLVCYWWS